MGLVRLREIGAACEGARVPGVVLGRLGSLRHPVVVVRRAERGDARSGRTSPTSTRRRRRRVASARAMVVCGELLSRCRPLEIEAARQPTVLVGQAHTSRPRHVFSGLSAAIDTLPTAASFWRAAGAADPGTLHQSATPTRHTRRLEPRDACLAEGGNPGAPRADHMTVEHQSEEHPTAGAMSCTSNICRAPAERVRAGARGGRWSSRTMRQLLAAALAARAAALIRADPKPQSGAAAAADAPWADDDALVGTAEGDEETPCWDDTAKATPWWEPAAEQEHTAPWRGRARGARERTGAGPGPSSALADSGGC